MGALHGPFRDRRSSACLTGSGCIGPTTPNRPFRSRDLVPYRRTKFTDLCDLTGVRRLLGVRDSTRYPSALLRAATTPAPSCSICSEPIGVDNATVPVPMRMRPASSSASTKASRRRRSSVVR